MKRIVFFLLVLMSCSKGEDSSSSDPAVGNWELYAYRGYDGNNNYNTYYETPAKCCIIFTEDEKLTCTENYDGGFIWDYNWRNVGDGQYNIFTKDAANNTMNLSNVTFHCNNNILIWDGESYGGGYSYFQRQGYNYQDCNELEYNQMPNSCQELVALY